VTWLAGILQALLEGALGFLGARMDKATADNAQREIGARTMESRQHERLEQAAREAMDLRSRPAGTDLELDDFMRAPGDRTAGRAD